MPCRTDICKGACCRFLVFNLDKKLTDDIKRFLLLHGVETVEVWTTKFHRRMVRTIIQFPIPCTQLDMETFRCRIYESRPENCRDNTKIASPFLQSAICSVLTPSLENLSEDDVKTLTSGKANDKDGKHTP